MQLNLPILDALSESKNILISGAGGGFDVFAGLPLYHALRERGKNVFLSNYSFSPLDLVIYLGATENLIKGILVGAHGSLRRKLATYPEGYLAQWFSEEHSENVTVWMFPNEGVQPVRQAYEKLIAHLDIDALILVDGGVDSIMRGDEEAPGTLIEDSISLAAVAPLDIPVKLLACIGFGTEVEEMLCHHHALENIAGLAKAGGFIGSCALTPQMESFQFFEQACRYVWEQPDHNKSHISTRIIPAVHGEFGNFHMYPDDMRHRYIDLFISPLMSLYWFFDANVVIQRNLLLNAIEETYIKQDAFSAYVMLKRTLKTRPRRNIPY